MTRVLITMRGTGGVSVWNFVGRELVGEGREGGDREKEAGRAWRIWREEGAGRM